MPESMSPQYKYKLIAYAALLSYTRGFVHAWGIKASGVERGDIDPLEEKPLEQGMRAILAEFTTSPGYPPISDEERAVWIDEAIEEAYHH